MVTKIGLNFCWRIEVLRTLLKLGQNFATISIPKRGFRNINVFICGKDVTFADFPVIPLSSSSLLWSSSLCNMANACWTLLLCPLFASILSRYFRLSKKSSIPTVVTLAQLLSITEPKVCEKSYIKFNIVLSLIIK